MAKLATIQLVQTIGARFTKGSPINQEIGTPPSVGFPHIMLNVKKVKHNMRLVSLKSCSLIARLGLPCKQDIYVSRVCRTRVKATCVTSAMFSCEKLWPGFSVATCSLR
jgi:hypothetical protein